MVLLYCNAFSVPQVLLCVETFKQNGLQRLLEAGGAIVTTPIQAVVAMTTGSLTHAFIHLPLLPKVKDLTIENLVRHKVPCLRPDYIGEYLQTVCYSNYCPYSN